MVETVDVEVLISGVDGIDIDHSIRIRGYVRIGELLSHELPIISSDMKLRSSITSQILFIL